MNAYKNKFISTKLFIALAESLTVITKKNEIIKCLDEGANINEVFGNDSDNTPLHIAVIFGEVDIVSLLLQRGAKTNYKNIDGKTALDIAKELDSDVGLKIIELLEVSGQESLVTDEVDKKNTEIDISIVNENDSQLMYNKRAGTSGIKGQLYESKLLSLVLLRATLNNKINQFYLGTCLNGIGALGDVCIRYIVDDSEGVVFLRVKHTNDGYNAKITHKDLWRPDGDFSLHKYFQSYLTILQKMQTENNADVLFKHKTANVKCTFALYTTAEIDIKDKILVDVNSMDELADDLICSSDSNSKYRYNYNEDDIALLTNTALIKHMVCIGKTLSYCIYTGNYDTIFNDSCIRKFHVVLAHHVIKVSETINDGHRIGRFRRGFFYNYDSNLVQLKLTLFKTFVANVRVGRDKLCELIDNVCMDPTVLPISKLMQNIITYYNQQNNILVITDECFKDITCKLFEVKVSYEIFTQAFELAINETIGLVAIKLPPTFGNIDITVEDETNCEKTLMYLANKLIEIITMAIDPDLNQIEGRAIDTGDVPLMDFNKLFASTVGNLLILDEANQFYKFNTNEQSLGKNAKFVLKILKSKIKLIDFITVKIQNPYFPKLTLDGDEDEKQKARVFFDNFWFYTCQSKEDEIEELGKEAIQAYANANKLETSEIVSASNARYNAVYFIIHDSVQKWWMTDEKSYYLKNDKHVIEKLLNDFSGKLLLNVISCMFLNRMRKYDMNFKRETVDCLHLQIGPAATFLITDVSDLTRIKLAQCYNNVDNYAFIDLNDIICLSKNDFYTILQELKRIKLNNLIIIYEDMTEAKNKIFFRLTEKSVTKRYILVTNDKSAEKLKLYMSSNTSVTVNDISNDLNDLTYVSQKKVLDKMFIFQGRYVKYSTIVTPESKTLIQGKVLQKIINSEIINIGKVLTNPYYEEIKHYYVQRHLHRIILPKEGSIEHHAAIRGTENEEIIKMNSLDTLKDTVVIVGAPGMGKSTFLTYLSIETKQINPSIWIERINLLDQTKELHRLKERNTDINKIDALKFICKAALTKSLIRFSIKPTAIPNFELEMNNGVVVLTNSNEIDYLVLFELEMLIHCYNQGNTIFLFDGFDEVCPHYKKEMTNILKCLVTRCSLETGSDINQRMWITSRSYNNIRETLEKEFGIAYNLKMFTNDEQDLFMTKYFQINISMSELDLDQVKNIDSFFEFMRVFVSHYPQKGGLKFYKLSTTFLQLLYFNAMNYFIREVNKPLASDKKVYTKKWASIFESRQKFFKFTKVYSNLYLLRQYKDNSKILEAATLIFTPLHIYIVMEYFINQIKTVTANRGDDVTKQWDFEISTLSFYKYFIETKLKKIRFEEKNQMDLYNPDIIITYEKELKEFMGKHKKLAFYATFKDNLTEILTREDIEDIRKIIQGVESGREKTGIVECILSNGIPKFVHFSFQEYLAAEYMMDLLKKKPVDQIKLWSFILSRIRDGFLDFFDRAMEFNGQTENIITDMKTKEMIFKDLTRNININDCNLNNATVLDRAMELGLKQITKVLLTAMSDLVNLTNLDEYICFVGKYAIFKSAADFGWDEVLCIILGVVRKVDPVKLSVFNQGVLKTVSYSQKSNIEIIRDFKWQSKKLKDFIESKKIYKSRRRFNTI